MGSCWPGVPPYGCGFPGAGAGGGGEPRGGAERLQLEPPAAGPVDGGIVSKPSRVGKGARKLGKGMQAEEPCQPSLSFLERQWEGGLQPPSFSASLPKTLQTRQCRGLRLQIRIAWLDTYLWGIYLGPQTWGTLSSVIGVSLRLSEMQFINLVHPS